MTSNKGWLTNSPEAVKALTRADNAYVTALTKARNFCLKDKIVAHREAKKAREAAYDVIAKRNYA